MISIRFVMSFVNRVMKGALAPLATSHVTMRATSTDCVMRSLNSRMPFLPVLLP
jgi:hypothetical protein